MTILDDDVERVVELVLKDVTATVGEGHADMVRISAAHCRQFCDDMETLVALLTEDVQQYFHDTFVSTTWPTCPRHPNHPMWIASTADGLSWCCERDRVPIALVGDLGSLADLR